MSDSDTNTEHPLWAEEHRSKTAFKFQESQSTEIIQRMSLSPEWIYEEDWSTDLASEINETSLALPKTFTTKTQSHLGVLEALSTEILNLVLVRLDIESINHFQQVNNKARLLVHLLPEYRAVTTHALLAYHAVFSAGTSDYVTLLDFYRVLRHGKCAGCSNYSGFVHMPTWTRYCHICMDLHPDLRMLPVKCLQRQSTLSKETLENLRWFELLGEFRFCIPSGIRSLYSAQDPVWLVLVSDCLEAKNKTKVSSEENKIINKFDNMNIRQSHRCFMPTYSPHTTERFEGLCCLGCMLANYGSDEDYWGSGDDVPGPGDYGCDEEFEPQCLYTRESFLEHFKWCRPAQLLWECSDKGTKCPRILHKYCEDDPDRKHFKCLDP